MGAAKGTEKKTINVDLPAETHRRLRIACATKDINFSDAVTQAVNEWTKKVVS